MFVKAFFRFVFSVVRVPVIAGVLGADKTGMSHSGVEGKLLLGHAQQVGRAPGAAGGSFAGQQGGSRLAGQAAPGSAC
jgi:hypothetical protein